ncbi:MAG: hypothetical protein WC389_18385 [Lutibacter sp.]|jgi:hypothetical protein
MKKFVKQKEYIAKIPLNEFISFLRITGVLEALFINHTAFNNLTEKEIHKIFNRDSNITIEFNEGLNEDIKCEIHHITLKSSQEDFKPILKKRK